ncbi:MAG: hypothetical protein LBD80_03190 [Tannerella sp.]|nr:hypothetical protein [Tannerella sp.]
MKKSGAKELTRYYLSGCYEIDDPAVGNSKEKLYLGGDYYTAAAVYVKSGLGSWQLYYICRDYLGSITHITNTVGSLYYQYSYDAWGRLRNPSIQTVYEPGSEPSLFLGRGYTGHEHLPQFGLINMNARLYDPALGRFMGMDPYVQSPDFTQAYNRYAYGLNNPLIYVDENGEFWHIIIGALVGGVINVVTNWDNIDGFWQGLSYFGVGAAVGGLTAAFPGAYVYISAGSATANSVLQQGFASNWQDINFQQVAFDGLMGGVTAYAGGKLGNAIGADNWFNGIDSPLLRSTLTNVTTNSIVGAGFGALSAYANGEDVWQGAWNGFKMGVFTGTISGIGEAAQFSIDNKVDFVTGRTISNPQQGNYSVYQGTDPNTGEAKYVGITERDPQVRFDEHLNSGTERSTLRYESIESGLSKTQARIMEQNWINQYGMQKNGGMLYNQRNSIAPRYWNRYGIKY